MKCIQLVALAAYSLSQKITYALDIYPTQSKQNGISLTVSIVYHKLFSFHSCRAMTVGYGKILRMWSQQWQTKDKNTKRNIFPHYSSITLVCYFHALPQNKLEQSHTFLFVCHFLSCFFQLRLPVYDELVMVIFSPRSDGYLFFILHFMFLNYIQFSSYSL